MANWRLMPTDRPGGARPHAVTFATWLAYLTGALLALAAVLGIVNADDSVDRIVRDHPEISRSVARTGVYVFVGGVTLFSALTVAGGLALRRGRRWAWVFLLALSGLGLVSIFSVRSLLDALRVVPDAALFACLLAASTRAFVSEQTYLSRKPDTSVPWYADN